MRALVTGTTGQIGYAVCHELARQSIPFLAASSSVLDITDMSATENCMVAYQPDVVIHCAAFTKVDQAEDQPDLCNLVNYVATKNIAELCNRIQAKMLYLSTDYVFPGFGNHFYEVDDATGPLNHYGMSKLAGEVAVRDTVEQHFILRTSWVFGQGENFVRTLLRLSRSEDTVNVVCDQTGSPTYAKDLAPLICDMVQTDRYGTYHATNEGVCNWYEFARAIFQIAGKSIAVHPVLSKDYPAKAKRPHNSRLSKSSLDENGFSRLPVWQDALYRYLRDTKDARL